METCLSNEPERLCAYRKQSVFKVICPLHQIGLCTAEFCLSVTVDLTGLVDQTDFSFQTRLYIGMYAVFIEDWLKVLPRDQLHVVRLEDYAQDKQTAFDEIFEFLQLSKNT